MKDVWAIIISVILGLLLPLIGYADDAIIVALALRSVAHRAGPDAITTHWPGTDLGLRTVLHAVGLAPTG